MLDKLKNLGGKVKDAISSTAILVGDLNGDGKVDEEDARIAAEWAKNTASSVGNEAARLGKEAIRSDLAKDAASGAAIGAAIAVPIPVLGPIAGAAIGAGLGAYKNFTKKGQATAPSIEHVKVTKDIHAELLKLEDLRQKKSLPMSSSKIKRKRFSTIAPNYSIRIARFAHWDGLKPAP